MHKPTTKLASFLFKERRLSQASLELSSSRGVFSSRESERKKREEEREERKEKQNLKIKDFIYKNKNLQKILLHRLLLQNCYLGYKTRGAYIGLLKV